MSLPAHMIDPYFVLSDSGTHKLSNVCSEGKRKPWVNPCSILHTKAPRYPNCAHKKGIAMVNKEQATSATIRGYLVPNFFPNCPAMS